MLLSILPLCYISSARVPEKGNKTRDTRKAVLYQIYEASDGFRGSYEEVSLLQQSLKLFFQSHWRARVIIFAHFEMRVTLIEQMNLP